MEDPRNSEVQPVPEEEEPKPNENESVEDTEISDEELDRVSGGMF